MQKLLGIIFIYCVLFLMSGCSSVSKLESIQESDMLIGKSVAIKIHANLQLVTYGDISILYLAPRKPNDDCSLFAKYVILPMLDYRFWEQSGYTKYNKVVNNDTTTIESIEVTKQLPTEVIVKKALNQTTLIHLSEECKLKCIMLVIEGCELVNDKSTYLQAIYDYLK